ncbi:MAG: choice-of-anchor J domain-containing protein, partial [Candidatus Krumholzibacteria bacterium]|nr:choice-of-anchor J domain-containing protein [Candidatus Krumholzibacteria bacterium]
MIASRSLLALGILLLAAVASADREVPTDFPQSRMPAQEAIKTSADRSTEITEGFEDEFPPTGWTIMTSGEASTWIKESSYPHSGDYCSSVTFGESGQWQDEWLVTKALDTSAMTGLVLVWFESGWFWQTFGVMHSILVSTTVPDDPEAFTSVLDMTPDDWTINQYAEPVRVNLDDHVGHETLYIAFRYQGDYADYWLVDDVWVYEPPTRDIRAIAVLPDGGILTVGSEVTPQFQVQNIGQDTETFDVLMLGTIYGEEIYSQTETVSDLAPFEEI